MDKKGTYENGWKYYQPLDQRAYKMKIIFCSYMAINFIWMNISILFVDSHSSIVLDKYDKIADNTRAYLSKRLSHTVVCAIQTHIHEFAELPFLWLEQKVRQRKNVKYVKYQWEVVRWFSIPVLRELRHYRKCTNVGMFVHDICCEQAKFVYFGVSAELTKR